MAPGLLFTAVACVHYRVGGPASMQHLAVSAVLFTLFLYVFDASNQARDVDEDAVGKSNRPVPSHLPSRDKKGKP